ncbi:MAG: ribosome biogenesis GTPase Der [Trichlorobacter sp.]|nr:ribosome biogenesis GTPase Der [Trichlorobacter sp.]
MKSIIAIVGRPNVGKSTLFNRISGERRAIVDDQPGVTRDRNYAIVERYEKPFILVDTGGFEPVTEDRMLQQMREQSLLAMEEADIILFMMDAKQGLTPADIEVANMLRRVEKPVLYLVNKVDGEKIENDAAEFYALGVDNLHTISSAHNRGIRDLLDELQEMLPENSVKPEDELTSIAVVGRPNVGKSSIVNRLLGFERVVANPTPGTTRDSVDTYFNCNKQRYCLIDTAGIRRKGKTSQKLEKYSVVDALKSIDRADIALIVLNAEEGITEQDKHIAGYVFEAKRACIFVVNKWDTLEKDNKTLGSFAERIRYEFRFLPFAPIVFISAVTGQRIHRVMEEVAEVAEQFSRRVSTSELNRVFKEAVEAHHAPLHGGRRVKFYFATQVAIKPPTFTIFTNQPEGVGTPYERYLGNRFREAFGFKGTPFRMLFRGRDKASSVDRKKTTKK